MFCPSCGAALRAGQKYCIECGASVEKITAGTSAPSLTTDATPVAGTPLPPPVLEVVEQTRPTVYEPGAAWDAGATATAVLPAQAGTTSEQPVVASSGFRITPLLVIAAIAGVLAVAAAAVDVVSYVVTGVVDLRSTYVLNDLSTNHLVGVVLAAVLMIGGAALAAAGWRVGSGLAGGAALALAGMVANAAGMAIHVLDSAQVQYLTPGNTITTTYELGFFLTLGAAGLAMVVFGLSLREAGRDGLPPITPAIGALGALGAVLVVLGTLLPQHGAAFADNFSQDSVPPATLLLRLVPLLLILVGGVLGFLLLRRWGLGLALGAISVGAWQWFTAITESGDIPLGIAGGNVGATSFKPHVLTTVGVVVMVVAGVAGLVIASQQRRST